MTIVYSIRRTALATLSAAGLWGLVAAPGAQAQVVADDVRCIQCVGKGDILDKAVTAKKIKKDSVFSTKILNRSIRGIDIGIGEVGPDEVAGLLAGDILDEAGGDFNLLDTRTDLTTTVQTIISVEITAPTDGLVFVNASGYHVFDSSPARAVCQISTGTNFGGFVGAFWATGDTSGADRFHAFGATRGFTVPAGSTTFNLLCAEDTGQVAFLRPHMTAIFAPTRY